MIIKNTHTHTHRIFFVCGFLEENSIKKSIFCMFRMLPGYKSRVYFAAFILEVFSIYHKKLLFRFCLQRRFRCRLGKQNWLRCRSVLKHKRSLHPRFAPIKINFLFKQMGQTHVNKLFKLLLNSQGVPFKISMGCQIWCLITQSSRKV